MPLSVQWGHRYTGVWYRGWFERCIKAVLVRFGRRSITQISWINSDSIYGLYHDIKHVLHNWTFDDLLHTSAKQFQSPHPTTTITMPCTRLPARAYYGSNPTYDSKKTPIIIGIVILVVFFGVLVFTLHRCSMRDRSTSSNRVSDLARAQQQRRENNGWWGAEPTRVETAAERRRRNIQVRANRNAQNEIEREVRIESGGPQEEDTLPKYQHPAPAYYSNPEWRRQHLAGRRELVHPPPPPQNDAPPAYDSPAVWPTGVRLP
jgi:hypothetical protein